MMLSSRKLMKNMTMFAISSIVITLTACQSLPFQQEKPDQFALKGKIGVRTPQQTGSAFYTWQQQQDQFDIQLTGILGIGKTHIQGKAGAVSLSNAQVGVIEASTPEELLLQATGWYAPISHLKSWIQAKSATAQAEITVDERQRPSQIIEDNWTVNLSYKKNRSLPNHLVLIQNLANGGQNRITMIINNR